MTDDDPQTPLIERLCMDIGAGLQAAWLDQRLIEMLLDHHDATAAPACTPQRHDSATMEHARARR